MSLEEELVELSTVYHGQREELEELRKQIEELRKLAEGYYQLLQRNPYNNSWYDERDDLQRRAKELLGNK